MNRINPKSKDSKKENVNTFFFACEFKPNTRLFSAIEPFAYDIEPAFIYGSLGIIAYEPNTYSIIDVDEGGSPLLGYIFTVTEPDTIEMLHKLKGCHGPDAYNTHKRVKVEAFTDVEISQDAWIFQLEEHVVENYEMIEQVEFGLWDENDEGQIEFLEKIGEAL